jgi:hypothetical protein
MIAESDPEYAAPHGRAVSSGEDPAAARRETDPEFQNGPERRKAHSGGKTGQPPAEASGQIPFKTVGVETGRDQGPGHEKVVLRVIGHHAAAEEKPVPVRRPEQLSGPPGIQPFVRQPERVSNRRPEETAYDGFFQCHHKKFRP